MNPVDLAALALILAGSFFLLIGSLGIVRLPDFYTRTHAAAKGDTLGVMLVILGLIVYEGLSLTSAKLFFVIVFVVLTNPVGAHALVRAAHVKGVAPWFREDDRPDHPPSVEEAP